MKAAAVRIAIENGAHALHALVRSPRQNASARCSLVTQHAAKAITLNNRVRVYNRRRNDWITIIYKYINKYIAGAISWAAGQQAAAAAAGQACAQSEVAQVL